MEYKFTVTQQELNMIIIGLGELPAKHVIGIISKLEMGRMDQDKERAISVENLKITTGQESV